MSSHLQFDNSITHKVVKCLSVEYCHFLDPGELEKMNVEEEEKAQKDKFSESIERLSLMIRFNHRGSLTSLSGEY